MLTIDSPPFIFRLIMARPLYILILRAAGVVPRSSISFHPRIVKVAFIGGQIALHEALLIHQRNRILRAQRKSSKIHCAEPVHDFLFLQIPIEEVAYIGLRAIPIPGSASLAAGG